MSMIGNCLQLTPAELQHLINQPLELEEHLFPDGETNENVLDVDKAWHGIHFLLTGDTWQGPLPLANVVLGGTEIGDDLGYGPARYLTPPEVQQVADALDEWPVERFKQQFEPAVLKLHEIYPGSWDEGDDSLEYLLQFYQSVRLYYRAAAESGNAMLKYLD